MLTIITEEEKVAPCRTPRSVQVTARAVSGLTKQGSELTTKAQVKMKKICLLAQNKTHQPHIQCIQNKHFDLMNHGSVKLCSR